MPNHLHLVTKPVRCANGDEFFRFWQRFKQRSAVQMNAVLERRGRFWQTHWYDRWIRDESEWSRWLRYVAANPVKGGLAETPQAYPYLRLPESPP
jgi:REP element-mobilizing transposase RayT